MALSASSVLNRNARVRSPGASAAVTASARRAPQLAVGQLQAAERDIERDGLGTVVAGSSTSIAEVSSSNSRVHAPAPVSDFSERIFSSGSESRCSR